MKHYLLGIDPVPSDSKVVSLESKPFTRDEFEESCAMILPYFTEASRKYSEFVERLKSAKTK